MTEKLFLARGIFLLIAWRLRLQFVPFNRLLTQLAGQPLAQPAARLERQRLLWIFRAACRLIPLTTCLSRAMAGYILLCRYGLAPTLHIGVAKDPEQELAAHAWLTLAGQVVVGHIPDLERFRELPPIVSRAPK
ncbi:MAG: lasso peptide biosynthesis B2 protein [Thermodesulfobacteriota bacterium]